MKGRGYKINHEKHVKMRKGKTEKAPTSRNSPDTIGRKHMCFGMRMAK